MRSGLSFRIDKINVDTVNNRMYTLDMNNAANDNAPAASATFVKVAIFRDEIRSLNRTVNVDFNACANESERLKWAGHAARQTKLVVDLRCKRSTPADKLAHVEAIERAIAKLSSLQKGITRHDLA